MNEKPLVAIKATTNLDPRKLSGVFMLLADVPETIPVYILTFTLADGTSFDSTPLWAADMANFYIAELTRQQVINKSRRNKIRRFLHTLDLFPTSTHLEILDSDMPEFVLYIYGEKFEPPIVSKERMRRVICALNKQSIIAETDRDKLLEQLEGLAITKSYAGFTLDEQGGGTMYDDEGQAVNQLPLASKSDARMCLYECVDNEIIHADYAEEIAESIEASALPQSPECRFFIGDDEGTPVFQIFVNTILIARYYTKRGAKMGFNAIHARYNLPIEECRRAERVIAVSALPEYGVGIVKIMDHPQQPFVFHEIETRNLVVREAQQSQTQVIKTSSNLHMLGMCDDDQLRALLNTSFMMPLTFRHPDPILQPIDPTVIKFYIQ